MRTAGNVNFALAVGPAVLEAVKTFKDFLAWADSYLCEASYTTPGVSTPNHFVAALLAKESGVDFNQMPYRGPASGVQNLITPKSRGRARPSATTWPM